MIGALAALVLAAGAGTDAYGGSLLTEEFDAAPIWFKVAGPKGAPTVIYLHGGPGYNAYGFEKAVGSRLERRLRMVYLDQRGGGRSPGVVKDPKELRMADLVADVERLRRHLNVPKIGLLAHSFGGLIALEYLKRYPDQVSGLVLVETTANLQAALAQQVEYAAQVAPRAFPKQAQELAELAASKEPASARLAKAYELVGRLPFQRQLHWASASAQSRAEAWDKESGLASRGNQKIYEALRDAGYLDSAHDELMVPVRVHAAVFGGRKSHVIGAKNLEAAAAAWRAPVLWFDQSGHFPFVEEPELFASRAVAVLASPTP